MEKGKMIGYYGNGAPKYENDDKIYQSRGYSPSYNPGSFDLNTRNSYCTYQKEGVWRRYW